MKEVKLRYKKSYVAFLDVLGFKKLVYSKKLEDKKKIELYLNEVRRSLERFKNIRSKQIIGSITISDSIILTVPFAGTEKDNIHNLRQLCIAILGIQRRLSKENIWIRGAITCGQTHFDEANNQVVGPAYIDAYLLEENIAKYPRVILDTKIIKELDFQNSSDLINEINNANYSSSARYQGDVLYDWIKRPSFLAQLEKDIPLFIDYMTRNVSDLETVFEHIENNVQQDISLYSKFQWVSKYAMTITDDEALLNRLVQI